jgi:hypothetical protein
VTPRRFYFQIRTANVVECITAHSLTEAKLIAAETGCRGGQSWNGSTL